MPKLIMLSAPSASGKSTLAWEMMQADGNLVRINRDDLRKMSITKWKPSRESWIIKSEIALCHVAKECKKNIVIDDTNLLQADEDRWKNVALEIGYTFEKVKLNVSLEECVRRDANREASIGRPAIERQFLRGKLIDWTGKRVKIWDVDGTLADLTHRVPWITIGADCPGSVHLFAQGPYAHDTCEWCHGTRKLDRKFHDKFYSLCGKDAPIEFVIKWMRAEYEDPNNLNLVVSGRSPENGTAELTITWLEEHNAPFHHIYMRRAHNHGLDTVEKQLILDDLLASGLQKEQIDLVVDDRPSVVAMWRENGLRVVPVRGRDDDAFYATMDDLEATHPRPELEEAASECVPIPTGNGGGDSLRPAESEGDASAPGVCC